jgi:hypothetical protein
MDEPAKADAAATAVASAPDDLATREAAYETFVWDNLRRNYIGNSAKRHYRHYRCNGNSN